MKNYLNDKNKGITLISLAITIIILLILVGTTINSLTGSGLFDKIKLAKERSESEKEIENSRLEEYGDIINSYINTSSRNTTPAKENATLIWEGDATSGEIKLLSDYKFSSFDIIRFIYTCDNNLSVAEKDIHLQSIEYTNEKENAYINLTGYGTYNIDIWKFTENKFEIKGAYKYVLNRVYGIKY